MRFFRLFILIIGLLSVLSARADWLDDIGWRALTNELGAATPTGEGVTLTLVESPLDAEPTGTYLPDTNDVQFVGKSIVDGSGINPTSSVHATEVAKLLVGLSEGVAPGVSNVFAQSSFDWYFNSLGRADDPNTAIPKQEFSDVVNHSWVAGTGGNGSLEMRLLDHIVWRDQPVVVVTLNNGIAPIPNILAPAYNVISVGRSDALHSSGTTLADLPGRAKPDLVGPVIDRGGLIGTSFAAPLVSGAAAVLLEAARGDVRLNPADDPRVVKAILMAGADKMAVSGWSNSATAPLDDDFGAGMLNVQNAFHVLDAGEGSPGPVNATGWAKQILDSNVLHRFSFSAPDESGIAAVHVCLNWWREVWDNTPENPAVFDAQVDIPNMTLSLYRATNGVPTVLLDRSMSPVDNVEYLYTLQLGGGEFVLEVETDAAVEYGLAWRSETVDAPEITDLQPTADIPHLIATLEPGYSYAVEAAIPGETWTNVVPAQLMTNDVVLIPIPVGPSERSYRLLQVY